MFDFLLHGLIKVTEPFTYKGGTMKPTEPAAQEKQKTTHNISDFPPIDKYNREQS